MINNHKLLSKNLFLLKKNKYAFSLKYHTNHIEEFKSAIN